MENILLFHSVIESGNYLQHLCAPDAELSIFSLDLCISDAKTVLLVGFELGF